MNHNCKYAEGGRCLCDACRSMQEAVREAEKVPKEEVDKLFQDAEKLIENIKVSESNGKGQ